MPPAENLKPPPRSVGQSLQRYCCAAAQAVSIRIIAVGRPLVANRASTRSSGSSTRSMYSLPKRSGNTRTPCSSRSNTCASKRGVMFWSQGAHNQADTVVLHPRLARRRSEYRREQTLQPDLRPKPSIPPVCRPANTFLRNPLTEGSMYRTP